VLAIGKNLKKEIYKDASIDSIEQWGIIPKEHENLFSVGEDKKVYWVNIRFSCFTCEIIIMKLGHVETVDWLASFELNLK